VYYLKKIPKPKKPKHHVFPRAVKNRWPGIGGQEVRKHTGMTSCRQGIHLVSILRIISLGGLLSAYVSITIITRN
jgi:hypothetical protein